MTELRQGWLTDDIEWENQLNSLQTEDVEFLELNWELAGGSPPAIDMSWVKFDVSRFL